MIDITSTIFFNLLAFLIMLKLIVFIHELGHFIFARLFKVNVEKFSVGFGPKIFSFKDKKGTVWQLSSIPLGGYVKMQGEFLINSNIKNEKHIEGAFQFAKAWQRFLIVLAGPFFNFLFSVILIVSIFLINGKFVSYVPNEISSIQSGSAADLGGLKERDKIISINDTEIKEFIEIINIVKNSPGKELDFKILRKDKYKNLIIKPSSIWSDESKSNVGFLGIINDGKYERVGISESLFLGLQRAFYIIKLMILELAKLISGKSENAELVGPIGIAKEAGNALSSGLITYIFFCAFISLNLGVINLFPIPALDGGHIIFYTYEMIFRKPLPMYLQNFLLRLGISLLVAIMVIVIFRDILKEFLVL